MSSVPASSFPRLVGDIGGTNARFATLAAPGAPLRNVLTVACADFPSLGDAIEHYLATTGAPRPRWAAIGIATAVVSDEVRMTNHHWSFSIVQLKARLGLAHLQVINDFTALAMALPCLAADELERVGGGHAESGSAITLLGAGTGLGISGLMPCRDGYVPITGEGGHVTLAAANAREAAVIAILAEQFPHVSAERVLSGPGLSHLHMALAQLDGRTPERLRPEVISGRGVDGSSAECTATLDVFCAMLGTVAANLALVLGSRGGVYIGGGIVPQLGRYFAQSPFRARFEQKGRFSQYLANIPTFVIRAPYPGLTGAARFLDNDALFSVSAATADAQADASIAAGLSGRHTITTEINSTPALPHRTGR
jgi:glucokinase